MKGEEGRRGSDVHLIGPGRLLLNVLMLLSLLLLSVSTALYESIHEEESSQRE